MLPLSIAEIMMYSTVKLTALKSGVTVGFGTGFFFSFADEPGSKIPALVTNKHVIEGCDQILAIFHREKDGKPVAEFARCTIDINPNTVVNHPDAKVDLCAVYIGDILNQASNTGTPIFFCDVRSSIIPQDEDWQYFDALEEVTMLGCPNGISDETNHFPIARRGITASSLSKDYNGKSEFMVDMACFPGSSGSPIFIYDRNGFLDRRTNYYSMGQSRVLLVGILYAGPLITNSGEVVLSANPGVTVATTMHLGYAIKSTALMEIDRLVRSTLPLK